MEGEEERSEDSRSFSKASIPKRIAICMAGATVNIIFGVIVFFILMSTTGPYTSNVVDSVIEGYPAQTVGLQANDIIIEADGEKAKDGCQRFFQWENDLFWDKSCCRSGPDCLPANIRIDAGAGRRLSNDPALSRKPKQSGCSNTVGKSDCLNALKSGCIFYTSSY